jgi:LCP family protein required for cell wall assembly
VLDAFSPEERKLARQNIKDLTLGPAARSMRSVVPADARIVIRFLPGDRKHPVAALANMRFEGVGTRSDGGAVPVRHEADYLLQPSDGRWLITGFRVRQRFVPPPLPSRDALFILAIGSDARPRHPVDRGLADSLHIIGVNPKTGVASILGIPRDSYVAIPGVGTQKINSSLFHGGPDLTVKTVERLSGIPIDGYLLTGFEGFRRMVSEVGGIEMRIPQAVSDFYSGAHFRAGETRLDGPEALAFSRNRHDAPGGDFGRSLNQGRLLIAALHELRGDVRRDPVSAFIWLLVGAKYMETDLTFPEMIQLGFAALSIDKVKNRVVSGSGGFAGSASVIRLGSSTRAMFRDLARDGTL